MHKSRKSFPRKPTCFVHDNAIFIISKNVSGGLFSPRYCRRMNSSTREHFQFSSLFDSSNSSSISSKRQKLRTRPQEPGNSLKPIDRSRTVRSFSPTLRLCRSFALARAVTRIPADILRFVSLTRDPTRSYEWSKCLKNGQEVLKLPWWDEERFGEVFFTPGADPGVGGGGEKSWLELIDEYSMLKDFFCLECCVISRDFFLLGLLEVFWRFWNLDFRSFMNVD